ncbi:MAG: hypothetical protein GWP10_20430 [Nitrospiraceae bacterium]|nr:hypothetical protein [Nitrospiraceae bacterium]
MVNFGKWARDRFKKDPMKVSEEELKRDQLKIDRLASIKRDEIEDVNDKLLKTIQKGKGQSKETKISLAVDLDVSKKKKMQLQKSHESLMNQKKALNMLEFMIEQKNAKQVSTIANRIFDMDVDRVTEIASDFAIEDMMKQDKLAELEGAMVGTFGDEKLSDETKQALEMWDELESGEMDEDEFFKEIEKSTEKLVVKREEEV